MKKSFLVLFVLLMFAACSITTGPKGDADSTIVVVSPQADELVGSPLTVSGRARGPWYFEGSFPVSLEDENGEVLASGLATAQSEWTTGDFVDFEAELKFNTTADRGTLILNNANASGLAENDMSFEVPVRFASVDSLSLVESYIRDNVADLSPVEAVLGGSWYVVSVEFEDPNVVFVAAEDGHIQTIFSAKYSIEEDGSVLLTNVVEVP